MPTTKKFLDQVGTGYLWGKITAQLDLKAAQSSLEALEDRVDELELNGYDDTAVKALIQANSDAIALKADDSDLDALDAKVTTLIGSDTSKSVRTIANEELAAQLIPTTAAEALDTLQEIAAWIQAHPGDAATMNSQITAINNILDGIGGTGESATVVAYVDAAISALSIGNYALASDLTTLAGRVSALETDTHTHTNKSVLDGITSEKVAAWDAAEANAKAYADGLAADYATAAQGAKADTALQASDITAGTANGTIAVKGTDVSVTGLGTAAFAASTAFDAAGAADAVYTAIVAMSTSDIDAAIAGT